MKHNGTIKSWTIVRLIIYQKNFYQSTALTSRKQSHICYRSANNLLIKYVGRMLKTPWLTLGLFARDKIKGWSTAHLIQRKDKRTVYILILRSSAHEKSHTWDLTALAKSFSFIRFIGLHLSYRLNSVCTFILARSMGKKL